ncbi:MAG: hypothetical protein Kow0069_31660 [Promethearchaeota archaeon]
MVDWLKRYGIDEERILVDDSSKPNINDVAPDRRVICVPYHHRTPQGVEVDLKAVVTIDAHWIGVKVLLLPAALIPARARKDLLKMLLRANFDLNEVTYSLDPDGNVHVETDMPTDTDYENFRVEFGSVEYGLQYFTTDISSRLQERINLRNTWMYC